MEIRRRQTASVSFALALAVLAALAIGLGAWNAAHRPLGTSLQTPTAAPASSSLSPDAQERNAQIWAKQLDAAQATHGH